MATPFETEMGVLPEIAKAINDMEWNLPTDIQSDAIPLILGGGDVLMAAETGSGKTGAFCLPVLQIVYESMLNGDKKPIATSSTWKMNVFDRTSAMAIDTEGLLCQSRDKGGWHSCRANRGVHGPGKYYFEATVTDDGLCRVGWATMAAKLELGTCPNSFGFGGTGKKSHRKNFEEYGDSFALGDTIGNCIDLDNNEIRWTKNGRDLGVAYQIPQNLRRDAFFPALSVKNAEIRFNFSPAAPPPCYLAIGSAVPARVVASTSLGGLECANGSGPADTSKRGPLAIIIEPSRELAEQTHSQLVQFSAHLGVGGTGPSCPRTCLVVGGGNTQAQQRAIRDGVEIVVATPGRLQDLVESGVLALGNCRFLVLDECDGLLAQGHRAILMELHAKLPRVGPSGERLQVIVCSATLHSFEVKKLADSIMQFPQWVDLKGEDSVPDTVHHLVCMVDPSADRSWQARMGSESRFLDAVHAQDRLSPAVQSAEMLSQAVKLAKIQLVIDAIRALKMDKALLFCRTKLDCDNLESRFQQLGGGPHNPGHQFSCVCLHSDRSAGERTANLATFKRGEVRFMICTDVAARGLDIRGLPYVINVTLPDDKENYVHRIGRVGRAERMGLAISLVATVKEKVWYHSCASRGKNCYNTRLTEERGCCIWYNEHKLLGDIEDHLGITIEQVGTDFSVRVNEFDGKVTYGEKNRHTNAGNRGHVDVLMPTLKELEALEKLCQNNYLNIFFNDTKRLY